MLANSTMIASAIAVPEADPPELSPNTIGRKRRQSEHSSEEQEESKRQRMNSPGKNSPTAAAAAATRDNDKASDNRGHDSRDAGAQPTAADSTLREARRKSSVADEKQRSKRLFGALLGSLNQPGDRTSKRRQEIESRRKAELQRQDDLRIEDKNRRREKVAEMRRKEQAVVDERNVCAVVESGRKGLRTNVAGQMRIRHSNMLDAANFLQTVSEPRLVR